MKFIRTIALLALSLAAVRCEAGEVHWDTFEGYQMQVWIDDGSFYGSEVQAYSVHDYSWSVSGSPEVTFQYTIGSYGNITRATPINMCSPLSEGQALLIDIMGTTRFQALPGLVDEIVL